MADTPVKAPVHLGDLGGPAGNAFVILGQCRSSLQALGRADEWPAIQTEMKSGNYEHLLDTVLEHFEDLDDSIALLREERANRCDDDD